jgi:holin-like protein
MVKGFMILLGFQLMGELLHRLLALPLPAPVIGMFLLAAVLLRRPLLLSPSLNTTARTLLLSFGLLFVPVGVGAFASFNSIRSEWVPILVALVTSTLLSLAATAFVMHAVSRRSRHSAAVASDRIQGHLDSRNDRVKRSES